LIAQKRAEPLRKKVSQVTELHYEILFAQPGWWVWYFNTLVAERDKMKDQENAERIISQGRQSLDKNNLQGLRNAAVQLLALLPEDVKEAVQRGFGSNVIK